MINGEVRPALDLARRFHKLSARSADPADAAIGDRMLPWNAEHAAGRITRPLRHNGLPYQGINVVMLWSASAPPHCGRP
jgi:antirestriction protein ArdC